jgi:hypothetical protein
MRSLDDFKASSLCRSNPGVQFGGGAAAGARNEGVFPGQVPHGRPRVGGPKETGRSVVSRVAVDQVPVCFCSPARGGRCYPVVTSWVSMEHWLRGSQVSKARPGAPFAFFRHGVLLHVQKGCGHEPEFLAYGVKAFEKSVFGPCTLRRTWGTRPVEAVRCGAG